MGKVFADVTISLDGFIAGPDVSLFQFVTDGIESALAQAQVAAGEKDVQVSGGADAIQQFTNAGLLDEIQVHISPIFLGEGIQLSGKLGDSPRKPIPDRAITSDTVTHVRYRIE